MFFPHEFPKPNNHQNINSAVGEVDNRVFDEIGSREQVVEQRSLIERSVVDAEQNLSDGRVVRRRRLIHADLHDLEANRVAEYVGHDRYDKAYRVDNEQVPVVGRWIIIVRAK